MVNEHDIYEVLEQVMDPEIPVLTIMDLGMIRAVSVADEIPEITITPTYSGCPATDAINHDIRAKMIESGIGRVKIKTQLSPAWTTEWMTDEGKQKLEKYGIAPPRSGDREIPCPHCNSKNVTQLSRFGSTPCKALYQCNDCKEPFEYFKCH